MTHLNRKLTALSAVTVLLLLAPSALVHANPSRRDANDGYGQGYMSKYELNETVRQLAYQSKIFQWQLERELNRSYLDGTSRERRANQLSVDFRGAAEKLHSLYAVGATVDNSAEQAESLLLLGQDLDDFVGSTRLSRSTLDSWDALRCKLSVLSDVYADSAEDAIQPEVPASSASLPVGDYRIWRWPF